MKNIQPLLLFAALWLCGRANAVIAPDTTATATSSSSSYTLSLSTSKPDDVILVIGYSSTTAISTGPSGGGLTWTFKGAQNAGSGGAMRAEVWEGKATSTLSSQTITITIPSAVASTTRMDALSGVDLSTGIDAIGTLAQNAGGATGSVSSASVTTANAGDFVYSTGFTIGTAPSAGTGYTVTSTAGSAVAQAGELANSATTSSGTVVTPPITRNTNASGGYITFSLKAAPAITAVKPRASIIMF